MVKSRQSTLDTTNVQYRRRAISVPQRAHTQKSTPPVCLPGTSATNCTCAGRHCGWGFCRSVLTEPQVGAHVVPCGPMTVLGRASSPLARHRSAYCLCLQRPSGLVNGRRGHEVPFWVSKRAATGARFGQRSQDIRCSTLISTCCFHLAEYASAFAWRRSGVAPWRPP